MEVICLINELTHGKELAKQLCTHLLCSSSSSHEENDFLIEKILSSYEKALSMLNWGANVGENKIINGKMVDFHRFCIDGSPRSEVIDQDFKHKDSFKKTKTIPRWTKQVNICPRTGLEGSLYDGYSWRKYGQKNILGAKFPRGYYRCTHRNVQGCLATKQVQRSDEDPTLLEITYRGRHTCMQASHLERAFPLKRKIGLGEIQLQKHQKIGLQEDKPLEQNPDAFFNFRAKHQVKTKGLDMKEDIFPSFCLTSSIGSENDNNLLFENHFMESISSPKFMSPTTTKSNILCLSLSHFESSGQCQNLQTSKSNVTDKVSALTSICNSPIAELNLFDFDPDFQEIFSS